MMVRMPCSFLVDAPFARSFDCVAASLRDAATLLRMTFL
jgi:hypothetical protein